MLIDGRWQENWQPVQGQDGQGRFLRQPSTFRHWITPDGSPGPTGAGGFPAEKDRYHLYVGLICPWASRTLMVRRLKGLADHIGVTILNPRLTDQGWRFGGFDRAGEDPLHGAHYLHELYTRADPVITGRATVPVLWDRETDSLVNNESADIVRMLNSAFRNLVDEGPDLYPGDIAGQIDSLNAALYERLNNGVYRAGFATSQPAYEEAYRDVFGALDELSDRLSDGRRFLFGERLTETDIRLFVTLVRFDAAYHGLFKCNRDTIRDMPLLHDYMHRILALDGVPDTVDLDHIKAGYYSIRALNPGGIVPVGPDRL